MYNSMYASLSILTLTKKRGPADLLEDHAKSLKLTGSNVLYVFPDFYSTASFNPNVICLISSVIILYDYCALLLSISFINFLNSSCVW